MARLPGHTVSPYSACAASAKKLAELGQRFIDEIMTYCRENRLQFDV